MSQLLGFHRTKTADAEKDIADKYITLAEQSYLNKTKYGEFNTSEEIQGLIDTLSAMPGASTSVNLQTKIAELQNKKLQFDAKKNDILNQKDVFDTELKSSLQYAAKFNYSDIKKLAGSYAAIYSEAAEDFDKDVMAKVGERYGTDSTIPAANLSYRKELQEKAKFYAGIFNAYNMKGADGKIGALNPEAYAVQIDTNPTNGSIVGIDIVPSDSVDEGKYMRTDIGLNVVNDENGNKLPMYLRTFDAGKTSDGKSIRGGMLGGVTFQALDSKSDDKSAETMGIGTLKAIKAKPSFWDKMNFISVSKDEQQKSDVESLVKNGLSLSGGGYKYDQNDMPTGTILEMGRRKFYQTDNGELWEADGQDENSKNANLNKYIQGLGKDPSKIQTYKVTSDYLVDDEQNSKVKGKINDETFSPAPVGMSQSTLGRPQQQISVMEPEKPELSSFFTAKAKQQTTQSTSYMSKNRQNKPNTSSAESSTGKSSINDIIDKGKSFFRTRVTA